MKSRDQRAFLHIHHPDVAASFEAVTPKGKKLPKKVSAPVKAKKKGARKHG